MSGPTLNSVIKNCIGNCSAGTEVVYGNKYVVTCCTTDLCNDAKSSIAAGMNKFKILALTILIYFLKCSTF